MPDTLGLRSQDGHVRCTFEKKNSEGVVVVCQWEWTGTTKSEALTALKIHLECSHARESAEAIAEIQKKQQNRSRKGKTKNRTGKTKNT